MDRRIFTSLLVLAPLLARPALADDPKFVAFIQNTLWPRMKKAGVSKQLFDAAFAGCWRSS